MIKINILPVLILLGVNTQVAGQQQAAIKLDGAATITLPAGQGREIRVAVSPSNKTKPISVDEDPFIVEASLNNVRSSELQGEFTPKWVKGPGSTAVALKIGVNDKITQPGKYSLILSLQPKSNPDAQKLSIELEQPAGELDVPSKILVRRTKYLPFCSMTTSTEEMPLNIRESTKKALLNNLKISWRSESLATGIVEVELPATSTINGQCASALPQSGKGILPAGCELKNVPYHLSGNFPLGVVNGNLVIFADQLTSPKTIPVEIQTRLTRWWLVVAVVPGLLLSFYLKFTLSKRIELNEVKAKAEELLGDINRDLANYQDAKFQAKLADPVARLQAVLQHDEPSRIEAQRKDTDQAWRDAVADLNNRLQAIQKSYDDWHVATLSSAVVPPPTQPRLAMIRQRIGDLQSYLKNRDADAGNSVLQELMTSLLPQFRDDGLHWQNKVLTLLSYLTGSNPPGLPRFVLADFDQALKQTPPDLNRLSSNRAATQPQDAAALIEDLAVEYAAAQDLLESVARRLEQVWSEINKALDPIRTRLDSNAFQILQSGYAHMITRLPVSAADPATALQNLPSQLTELQTQWTTVLTAVTSEANGKEIADLLAKQDFLSAASKLSSALSGKGGQLLGPPGAIARTPWPMAMSRKAILQTVVVGSSIWPETSQPTPFRSVLLTPEQQLKKDKKTQTLIVGGIVLGYLLVTSSQSYTGAWTDVWGAFLTALAADFTLDSILSKFKR